MVTNLLFRNLPKLALGALMIMLMQACAGSGMTATDSTREYSKEFTEMQEIVNQAIRGTNIVINDVQESDDKLVLSISRYTYNNEATTYQESGLVVITKLAENKTSVKVQDPRYEFSVPDHQREHYKRHIFRQIDAIIAK